MGLGDQGLPWRRRSPEWTIYLARFLTTACDLVSLRVSIDEYATRFVAVYRHQVEACAEAGPELLVTSDSPHVALGQWVNLFVDFLVTKHGLAAALQSDSAGFDALHGYFLDRLVPVCALLLDAAAEADEISPDIDAYGLMRGIGSLCIGADNDPNYDARRMVDLLLAGLLRSRLD